MSQVSSDPIEGPRHHGVNSMAAHVSDELVEGRPAVLGAADAVVDVSTASHPRACTYWRSSRSWFSQVWSVVAELIEAVSEARRITSELSERLHDGPLALLLDGHVMPWEAFYLLVAMRALNGGAYPGDAHADFQMLRYEDGERRCYICLDERPPEGHAQVHLGMYPEELSWARRRP